MRSLMIGLMAVACSSDKGVRVHNTAPTVSIIEPVDGTAVDAGEVIEFVAVVGDDQDREEDLEIRWASDLDDVLDETPADSEGNAFYSTSVLSVGTHTLMLTAIDTRGRTGSDHVQLEILDVEGSPEITILSPTRDETGAEGVAFFFKALVSDEEDLAVDLLVRMGAEIQGDTGLDNEAVVFCEPAPDESGLAACEYTFEPGEHELVFEVEDLDENITTARRVFTVVDDDDVDNDGDSFTENDGDCDDDNAEVNPEAAEACNGIDDDCDGDIDEEATEATVTYYLDADLDGFGDAEEIVEACALPDGYAEVAGDCNDGDEAVHPDADERCNEIDDDCDGETDEAGAVDEPSWYTDADLDGFGDEATAVSACVGPAGMVSVAGDCDDDAEDVHPDAEERCNGVDDNCDGVTDEDTAVDATTYFRDLDGDTFGDPVTSVTTCTDPGDGWVLNDEDCDDVLGEIHPDADEVCDDQDNDCDEEIDEDDAVDATSWYLDTDGDFFGVTASAIVACEAPDGHVSRGGDCNDTDPDIRPDATEICDGDDNNCDGSTDGVDAIDAGVWYADSDDDGYGDPETSVRACVPPDDHVDNDDDCDDGAEETYLGAPEICDGEDNDCDDETDEEGATGELTWYEDYDLDGHGDPDVTVEACTAPPGFIADAGDCDDEDGDVYTGHPEVCDGKDNNCDGDEDEDGAAGCQVYYRDVDDDGYGSTDSVCSCGTRDAFTADNSLDCYDDNGSAYPDAGAYHDDDRGDGSYDYNCDGSQSKRWTGMAGACRVFTDACDASNGWTGSSSPSCGSSRTWKSGCYWTWDEGCVWSSSGSRTQQCR